jgi:sugar/nucleoside kinase (ribokinase family)
VSREVSAPDLLVCGSLTIDNVVTATGELLPRAAAGNAVYAALGAAIWGHKVGVLSRAGADFPQDFLSMLRDRGLDLGGIVRRDEPHGMNVAFAYANDGSRVRAFPPDIVARIPPAERARFVDYTTRGEAHRYTTWFDFSPDASDIPADWARETRAAHLAAMPVQRQIALAQHLRRTRPDRHVQLDSPWHDERVPAENFHAALLHELDLLLPSEADLALWRPGSDPLDTASALAREAGRRILVKRGGAGALLIDADGRPALTIPPWPATMVDPTGAGDAFCGGVLAGILLHRDFRLALACGTASASFAIEGVGPAGLLRATRADAARRADWVAARIAPTKEKTGK